MYFEIIEIVRYPVIENFGSESYVYFFDIFLYDNKDFYKFKLSEKHYVDVINGMYFKKDTIEILSCIDGVIEIRIIDDLENLNHDNNDYSKYKIDYDSIENVDNFKFNNLNEKFAILYRKTPEYCKYLPFLSDSPIFNTDKLRKIVIKNQKSKHFPQISTVASFRSGKTPIIGLVQYKSRIFMFDKPNITPYYFFIILSSGYKTAKIFFWRRNAVKYHQNIKTGDILLIKNIRTSKHDPITTPITLNSYVEYSLIEGKELQVQDDCEVFKCLVRDDNDSSTDNEKQKSDNIIKEDIHDPSSHGYINIFETKFSKEIFHSLKGKIVFMGILMRKRSKNNPFLQYKDKILEFMNIKIIDDEKIYYIQLFNNSSNEFGLLKINDFIEVKNIWKIERKDFAFYTSSAFTEIHILKKKSSEPEFMEYNDGLIENALCFLPDTLSKSKDLEDVEKIFVNKKSSNDGIPISKYFYPDILSLEDLLHKKENLVINETRKYMFKATMLSYDLSSFDAELKNDQPEDYETSILLDLVVDGKDDYEDTGYIKIKDFDTDSQIRILVYPNKFNDEKTIHDVLKKFNVEDYRELNGLIGKKLLFVVDGFRASHTDVILCLSKILKD